MRILVTGASGRLGSGVLNQLIQQGRHHASGWCGTSSSGRGDHALRPVDLTDPAASLAALEESNPDVLIHCGAISAADEVRRDPARGRAVNVEATRRLAEWATLHGRRLVFTSTDLVFDGSRPWWREDDLPCPLVEYGRTKRDAEAVVAAVPGSVVARVSLLFGPNPAGRAGFLEQALEAMRQGEPRAFFDDEFRTPLDYRTAAEILIRLAESDWTGIVHVAGRERLSRYEMMRRAAAALNIDPRLVQRNSLAGAALAEPRPADVSLDTSRLTHLFPGLERPSIESVVAGSDA